MFFFSELNILHDSRDIFNNLNHDAERNISTKNVSFIIRIILHRPSSCIRFREELTKNITEKTKECLTNE